MEARLLKKRNHYDSDRGNNISISIVIESIKMEVKDGRNDFFHFDF